MKALSKKAGILASFVMIAFLFSGWAKAPHKSPDLGLCPIKESAAYKQFMSRPVSEYSKTLYLIERFKNLPYEVVYDGGTYKIPAVSGMVRAFLRFNYKKEWTAEKWVMKYAHRSLGKNRPILLRLSDGSTYEAGNILLEELANLETARKEITLPEVTLPLSEEVQSKLEGSGLKGESIALAVPNTAAV